MKINHNPDQTTYSIVFFTPPSKQKQKARQSILFCKILAGFLSKLSYLKIIIYSSLFHADASLQWGSSVRQRKSTNGSATIPRP